MANYRNLLAVISAGSFLLLSASSTRNRITNEPSGIIQFENAAVDFGQVTRGQKLKAKFSYVNVGKGPLVIQGFQAPCDCTTVETGKGKPIAPGESSIVEVVFDTTDYAGRVTKTLTVVTNERSMPDRTLTVSANVASELMADPPMIDFGELYVNQSPKVEIRLKGITKQDIKLEKLKYNEELLDIGYNKDGKDWLLHVRLKPTAQIGFLKETIYAKTNAATLPELPIPVRATVKGQIASAPSYLEFGSLNASDKTLRQVQLTGIEAFDIVSNKIELLVNGSKTDKPDRLMRVSVEPIEKHGKKISLTLENPGDLQGSVHGKVVLETTNPQQKQVTVDFYAFFR